MTKQLIDKGLFSKVYKISPTTVEIISECPVKEALALFTENLQYFPKYERIDYQLYHCELYEKPKSLKNSLIWEHYKIYQKLREFGVSHTSGLRYNELIQIFENFDGLPTLLKAEFLIVLNALAQYTDKIAFEISPRNVAVKNKRLILLDVFVDANLRQEKRKWNKILG